MNPDEMCPCLDFGRHNYVDGTCEFCYHKNKEASNG